jgi:hypothetical protein
MTTRHVKVVSGPTYDGNAETDAGTLAAKVYAVVNGATVISITAMTFMKNPSVCVIYDTA